MKDIWNKMLSSRVCKFIGVLLLCITGGTVFLIILLGFGNPNNRSCRSYLRGRLSPVWTLDWETLKNADSDDAAELKEIYSEENSNIRLTVRYYPDFDRLRSSAGENSEPDNRLSSEGGTEELSEGSSEAITGEVTEAASETALPGEVSDDSLPDGTTVPDTYQGEKTLRQYVMIVGKVQDSGTWQIGEVPAYLTPGSVSAADDAALIEIVLKSIGLDTFDQCYVLQASLVTPLTVKDSAWNVRQYEGFIDHVLPRAFPVSLVCFLIFLAAMYYEFCAAGHVKGEEDIQLARSSASTVLS